MSAFPVFIPCGDSPADMTLRFIDLQNLLYLLVKSEIAPLQPLRQILMYRRFGYTKMLCRSPNGGLVLDDVHGQIAGPFLDEVLQSQHSLHTVLEHPMSIAVHLCKVWFPVEIDRFLCYTEINNPKGVTLCKWFF